MSLADIQVKKFKEKIRHIAERFIIDPEVISSDIKKIDDNIKDTVSSLFFVTTDSNQENMDMLDYLPDSIVSLVDKALEILPHDCLLIQNPDFYLPVDTDLKLIMSTNAIMGKSTAGDYDESTKTLRLNWDRVTDHKKYVTSLIESPTAHPTIDSGGGIQLLSTLVHEYGHHMWHEMVRMADYKQYRYKYSGLLLIVPKVEEAFKLSGVAAPPVDPLAPPVLTEIQEKMDADLYHNLWKAFHDDIQIEFSVVGAKDGEDNDLYDDDQKVSEVMARMRSAASLRNYYKDLDDMFDRDFNVHDIMYQESIDFFDAFIWGYAADVMRYK